MAVFSLLHGALALAVIAACGLLYREIRRPAPPALPAPGTADALRGVHGWLAFLIGIFVLIAPGVTIARYAMAFDLAEAQEPALLAAAGWLAYKYAVWMVVATTALLSVAAGVGLARQRNPGVVRRAQVILWINGPVAGVFATVTIPLLLYGHGSADALFYAQLVTSMLGATIWTAYLSLSRRVRNTYFPAAAARAA